MQGSWHFSHILPAKTYLLPKIYLHRNLICKNENMKYKKHQSMGISIIYHLRRHFHYEYDKKYSEDCENKHHHFDDAMIQQVEAEIHIDGAFSGTELREYQRCI